MHSLETLGEVDEVGGVANKRDGRGEKLMCLKDLFGYFCVSFQ